MVLCTYYLGWRRPIRSLRNKVHAKAVHVSRRCTAHRPQRIRCFPLDLKTNCNNCPRTVRVYYCVEDWGLLRSFSVCPPRLPRYQSHPAIKLTLKVSRHASLTVRLVKMLPDGKVDSFDTHLEQFKLNDQNRHIDLQVRPGLILAL